MSQRSNMPQGNLREQMFQTIIPGVSQKIAFAGTSTQATNAFQATTTLLRIFATTDCFILVGSSPTVLVDGTCYFVPGGIVDFIGVQPGQKIAAIQSSASGTLYITEAA
jgi:hypothetical protein